MASGLSTLCGLVLIACSMPHSAVASDGGRTSNVGLGLGLAHTLRPGFTPRAGVACNPDHYVGVTCPWRQNCAAAGPNGTYVCICWSFMGFVNQTTPGTSGGTPTYALLHCVTSATTWLQVGAQGLNAVFSLFVMVLSLRALRALYIRALLAMNTATWTVVFGLLSSTGMVLYNVTIVSFVWSGYMSVVHLYAQTAIGALTTAALLTLSGEWIALAEKNMDNTESLDDKEAEQLNQSVDMSPRFSDYDHDRGRHRRRVNGLNGRSSRLMAFGFGAAYFVANVVLVLTGRHFWSSVLTSGFMLFVSFCFLFGGWYLASVVEEGIVREHVKRTTRCIIAAALFFIAGGVLYAAWTMVGAGTFDAHHTVNWSILGIFTCMHSSQWMIVAVVSFVSPMNNGCCCAPRGGSCFSSGSAHSDELTARLMTGSTTRGYGVAAATRSLTGAVPTF